MRMSNHPRMSAFPEAIRFTSSDSVAQVIFHASVLMLFGLSIANANGPESTIGSAGVFASMRFAIFRSPSESRISPSSVSRAKPCAVRVLQSKDSSAMSEAQI